MSFTWAQSYGKKCANRVFSCDRVNGNSEGYCEYQIAAYNHASKSRKIARDLLLSEDAGGRMVQ